MELLISIYNTILYRPLFNGLILLYKYIPGHDFGLAVIVLTILIKTLLYPLGTWAIKSQKVMSEIQPKLKEVQEKYKQEKEKQAKAVMELYKEAKINPFSGCLPLLIQIPLLIALYQVFWKGLQPDQMNGLYSFVSFSGQINSTFLGLVDLAKPSLILAVLAGILQFWQTKTSVSQIKAPKKEKKSDFSNMLQKQMQYFFPVFTVLILLRIPSAVGLYWATTTLFSIIQQYIIFKKPLKT